MSLPVNIIAIGGGGFTHDTDASLETYLLEQLTEEQPSIGFIPTASGDSEAKIERFYKRFNDTKTQLSHLSLFGAVSDIKQWIFSQHLIYVGGGNTKSMLGVWREWGLPELLLGAARQGAILSGVSAGAACWFESSLSDSAGDGLQALPALGFTNGSCCPHYSTESARQQSFSECIAQHLLPEGIAIDDGVAVHIRDDEVVQVVSARENANAYRVALSGDSLSRTIIDPVCRDY